jgi:nicotinamide-nucleotide amidase
MTDHAHGLVTATITARAGASAVLRGGVVVYATDTKASQLGVDRDLLEARGPVDAQVAEEMARGVRARWGADLGLATTGVAGPEPQDGHPVGEVYVAVADAAGAVAELLDLKSQARSAEDGNKDGDAVRAGIRGTTVARALDLVFARIQAG